MPADFSNIAPPAPFVALGLVATILVALLVRWAWPGLSLGPLQALSVRFVRGPDDVDTWSILSMSKRTHRIERTGDRSLTIATEGGTFFDGGFVEVYRSKNHRLPAGTVVEMKGRDGARRLRSPGLTHGRSGSPSTSPSRTHRSRCSPGRIRR